MKSYKEIYEGALLQEWQERSEIFPEETYVLNKYCPADGQILEAGCGGGRIMYFLSENGHINLTGFDFVPEMIGYAQAKKAKTGANIQFSVGDATRLEGFADNKYTTVLYLQQLLSFINRDAIPQVFSEANRVSAKGAYIVMAVLNYNGRFYSALLIAVLAFVRLFNGDKRSTQHQPWLFLTDGKFNWRFWKRDQVQNYWFKVSEMTQLLTDAGYEVVETFASSDIPQNQLKGNNEKSFLEKFRKKSSGVIYFVAQKK
jgi:ubiquinone/menaquinone biosynthesis C-methylase UbiE